MTVSAGDRVRADLDRLRIAQDPRGEALDLRRERGGKKQRLAIGRDLLDDPAHIGEETHVEHAIDFIEDEHVHVAHVHRALLEQIEQAPGRGADHIRPGGRFLLLFAVADAAVDERDPDVGEASVIAERGFDLRGEFARRLEHEAAKGAVFGQVGQNREGERGGLAGAGLRGADQVFAREDDRERPELDGRGIGEPHRLGSFDDLGREAKILKRHGPKVVQTGPEATAAAQARGRRRRAESIVCQRYAF